MRPLLLFLLVFVAIGCAHFVVMGFNVAVNSLGAVSAELLSPTRVHVDDSTVVYVYGRGNVTVAIGEGPKIVSYAHAFAYSASNRTKTINLVPNAVYEVEPGEWAIGVAEGWTPFSTRFLSFAQQAGPWVLVMGGVVALAVIMHSRRR